MSAAANANGPAAGAAYVALGDSYAAGEGLGPFQAGTDEKKGPQRNQCHRSQSQAYADLTPAVVLPWVSDRALWACSGATIADMETAAPQAGPHEQYRQPNQTATVSASTRWISMSVGGDDLQFGEIGQACGGAEISHRHFERIPGQPPCATVLDQETAKLGKLQSDLEALYDRLLAASPNAKLVAVGYPRIFPASYKGLPVYQHRPYCILDHYPGVVTVDVGLPVSDATAVDKFEVKLNSTIQAASRMTSYPSDAARVTYADTYSSSVARNCKGTTPNASVAGLVLSPRFHGIGPWYKSLVGSGTFHPTADGQRMMASAVQSAFTRLGARAPEIHGGSGTVTPQGKIGALQIGRSTAADIVRFAGQPDQIGDGGTSGGPFPVVALGYQCANSNAKAYLGAGIFCHVAFYIKARTGRLVEFATDSSRYAALGTIRVGMRTRQAERYAHQPAIGGCVPGIRLSHGRFGSPGAILLTMFIDGARQGRPRIGKNGSGVIPLFGGHVGGFVLDGGADVFDCA